MIYLNIQKIKLNLAKGISKMLHVIAGHVPSNSIRVKMFKFLGANIGENVYVGYDLIVTNSGNATIDLLTIENNVAISPRVTLLMNVDPNPSPLHKIYPAKCLPIHIKKGAWVGACSIILPGITIGEFSIVAAGAVVVKDVLPYTVVAGVPAKVVKYVSPDECMGDT